jgi:hypothetical protein
MMASAIKQSPVTNGYPEIGDDAAGTTGSNFNINQHLIRWLKCETDYAL